jgi:hypothetical protein
MRDRDPLLPLEEATRRLHPHARFHLGVVPIPVRQIVGSEGRTSDFDRSFAPRRRESLLRRRELERAFPDGDFPPIVVEQLGDAYFVLDGHHRVAIARARGMEAVDADVTVLQARWRLGADATLGELAHAEQEWLFMRGSGLGRARPNVRIRVSDAVGYSELLAGLQAHGYALTQRAGTVPAPEEVAVDWYERVYLPAVETIERVGIDGACADATAADCFLWALGAHRRLQIERPGATFEDALRRGREQSARPMRLLPLRRPR